VQPDASVGFRYALGNCSMRCSRPLFLTRLYRFHPWNRTSCIHAVVPNLRKLLHSLLCIRAVTPNLQSDKPDLSGPVGWVERSETQHFTGWQMPCRLMYLLGFATLYPTYGTTKMHKHSVNPTGLFNLKPRKKVQKKLFLFKG